MQHGSLLSLADARQQYEPLALRCPVAGGEHPSRSRLLEPSEPGYPRGNDAGLVGRAVWEMGKGFPGWLLKDM